MDSFNKRADLDSGGGKAFANGAGNGGGARCIGMHAKGFGMDREFGSGGGDDDSAKDDVFGLQGGGRRIFEQ